MQTRNQMANHALLDNRLGCCVGHAFLNSNPPFRLHDSTRSGGRKSLVGL